MSLHVLPSTPPASSRCGAGISAAVRAIALVATGAACRGDADARPGPTNALVVGFVTVGATERPTAEAGAALGSEEAERTGALLGRSFTLRIARGDDVPSAVKAAERLIDDGASALVGGDDIALCRALDSLGRARQVLYVNTGCREDALRSASGTTFHVEASDSMYHGAFAAMRASGGAAPVLWHGGLSRYGAAQLNQRFVRRFGAAPDERAWATWMAMKILWQAALEARSTDAAQLAAVLTSDSAEFDGHKGEALRFDAASHQLRQPLFPPRASSEANDASGERRERLGTTDTGGRTALRKAIAAGTRLLVVSNEGSSEVTIHDAASGERLATIPLAERPRGVHVSGDGRRAWVALSDESPTSEGDGDAVALLDLREGSVVRRHAAGSDPEQFAMDDMGRMMVAANEDAGTATLTDLTSDRVLATLVVGIEPEGVAMSPDARWVYVTAETSNTVSVIDVRRREVVASFLVDERPRAAVVTPDGRRALVTNEISGTLTVIGVPSHEIVGRVTLAGGSARPVGVVVSPDGTIAYVANGRHNSVSVVDLAALRETATIPVGRRPWGLALSRDGRVLYAANGGSDDVSVIDTRSARVTATIPVGERPWGVAVTR